GYAYSFPRDHFNHPEFQTEWWYYTGNVLAGDGHRYGFELTFFRQGVDRSTEKTGTWDARDVYLAHLALTDGENGRFRSQQRMNRAGPGIAGASEAENKVWNGNWSVKIQGDTQTLQAVGKEFSLDLKLQAVKAPTVNGANGVSQKSAGAGRASHYI